MIKNNKLLFVLFALMVLVQIYVPGSMIIGSEQVLKEGNEFKFKVAPRDPNDPFKGKYITLNFEADFGPNDIQDKNAWVSDAYVFVSVIEDKDGFAKISSISDVKPNSSDYFEAQSYNFEQNEIRIRIPFDKYYMEESKAYPAELIFFKSLEDTSSVTYALVNIKNGSAVLKDVQIDGVSIRDMVQEELLN